jgi:hypothetical protein
VTRASDAEREAVVARLRDAAGRGDLREAVLDAPEVEIVAWSVLGGADVRTARSRRRRRHGLPGPPAPPRRP